MLGLGHQDFFFLRSLSFLVKLEQLDLGGNDLEVLVQGGLPGEEQVGYGAAATGGCHTGLPHLCPFLQPDTLGALPNLRELWLDRNQLSALPPVSGVGLALSPYLLPFDLLSVLRS